MRVLITGICGFVGNILARELRAQDASIEIIGLDNLVRAGSELNRHELQRHGIKFFHADIRSTSDVDMLPTVHWVIDAAANASVLAGVNGTVGSRQLVEHNLGGTVNLLEYCQRHRAGFILLSTSRVYSISPLASLKMEIVHGAFRPRAEQVWPRGLSPQGIAEEFSTSPPISLYGSTKLASEILAMEYSASFGFPVFINRCGVLAGAGQFGRADQGIFSYWIHSYVARRPLKYIGFDGRGHQVRDCFHPRDLVPLLVRQMNERPTSVEPPLNLGGGSANSMSLRQLSDWCEVRFGRHEIAAEERSRAFDIPWVVMDPRAAEQRWNWKPQIPLSQILEEIADHAVSHPEWIERSNE
jgi:CDP-paratose 2-epimerase